MVVRIVIRYILALRLPCNTSKRFSFPHVSGCDRARFTFTRSAGARGDQKVASPDDIIAERLSARQLIVHRISEIVSMYVCMCMYVCMYVSVTLRNAIISRATRKRTCTCASGLYCHVTAGMPCLSKRLGRGAYSGLLPLQASCI